jgi:Putative Flp pilus-assembly TadE/G-like
MIFAISLIPLIYLTGMGVDYGSAAMREAELNAIADSASLAAVTPAMMAQGDSASVTAATNYFNAQATALTGVTYTGTNLTVTVADSITARTVTVAYTAASSDFFPSILGRATIALGGSSTAVGSVAPNINFYLLLDDSPSMAIPASQSGITTLESYTTAQGGGGCAFACHESNPSKDNLQNPKNVKCANGSTQFPSGGEDNYALAQCLGLTLRMDNLRTAVQNLTTTATTTEQTYSAAYQMAVYTFDVGVNTISTLTSNLSSVSSDATNIQALSVYDNSCLTSTNCNNDQDTAFDVSMKSMNTTLPAPGNGTNAKGDTPQEVLFLVTDGVVDQNVSSEPSLSSAYGSYTGSRQQSTVNPLSGGGSEPTTDWCTSMKNRGIRIAVLYTTYYPLGSNSWYNTYIAPLTTPAQAQDNIGARLQACASPGLYYEVTTGGDISAAMNALFQEAVSTAHLLK